MRRWLRIAPPILILIAIGIYLAFPRPTHDDTTLKAVAIESRRLIAIHPVAPGAQPVRVPKNKWPLAIASLEPETVT